MISKRCSKGACRLKPKPLPASAALYRRIAQILESARSGVARTVNTTQVVANWLIGREIVEAEQRGKKRAQYGERLLDELSKKLTEDFGAGFSVQGLRYMRQFYQEFPVLISQPPIRLTLRGISPLLSGPAANNEIHHTPCGELDTDSNGGTPAEWKPGQLSPNLSWSLYRHLLRVALPEARAFYEIEAIQNRWSARELERQINSLLYDRLAASRDKKGLLRLARNGQEIAGPLDVFKDPLVLEFLKIPPARQVGRVGAGIRPPQPVAGLPARTGQGLCLCRPPATPHPRRRPFLHRSGLLPYRAQVLCAA
jgi:predicted nuclease of restriction endonuclease-like (RecB) superfamily